VIPHGKVTSPSSEMGFPRRAVGRRSFPVAASTFWNTLPDDIQSAPSVSAFRRLLKTLLFHHSFPDVIPLLRFRGLRIRDIVDALYKCMILTYLLTQ